MASSDRLSPSKLPDLIFSSEELRHQYELSEHYKSVVCGITVNDTFRGTGFLIGGNLLMTASHVIDAQTAKDKDNKCLAVFYYIISQTIDKTRTYKQECIIKLDPSRYLYSHPAPPDEQPPDSFHLDFTIVAIAPQDYLSEVQDRCFSLFKAVEPTVGGLAIVCQCPPTEDSSRRKENLSKSAIGRVQNQEKYSFLYDAVTKGGSSGGAVINSNGELIGLHNGTVGMKRIDPKRPWCNEGVLMIEIVKHLKNQKGLQEEIEKLIEDYKTEHPNKSQTPPDAEPGIINLKLKHPDFISRQNPKTQQNYFEDLSNIFLQSVPIKRPVVDLWGDGGVGKSEIAIAFGNDYAGNFYFIHLIECDIQATINEGYTKLGKELNKKGHFLDGTESSEEVLDKIHTHLEKEQFSKPWLLIFDNVKDPSILSLPQRGNGAIIITSRQHDLRCKFIDIEVTNFTENESLNLLKAIIETPETKKRKKLVKELAFIPLLLNQVAHFIKATSSTEKEYLTLMGNTDDSRITVFEDMPEDLRYRRTLLVSWKITFDALLKQDPEALDWLQFCSYLYPDAIPQSWIKKRLSRSQPNESRRSIKALAIRGELSSTYALMGYDQKTSSMSIHRYKQATIRSILESEEAALRIKNELLLFLENEAKEWSNVDEIIITLKTLEEFFAWGPNAAWFLKYFSQNLPNSHKSITRIKEALANYRHFKGDYKTAEKNYEENLSKSKELYGENSAEVALTLSNLGINAYKTGDFEKATTKLNQALEIRQRAEGDQRGPIADIKSTLGQILHRKGQGLHRKGKDLHKKGQVIQANEEYKKAQEHFEGAKELFKIALELKKEKHGSDHRSVARALHCLGRIAYEQKDYGGAKELLNQALAIREKAYKTKTHTELAHNKNDLGLVLYKQGAYKESETIFQEVFEMRNKLYGEGHPETAVTQMNLGQVYHKQGQYQKAKSFLEESCDILEKSGHRLISIAKGKLQKVLDQISDLKKN